MAIAVPSGWITRAQSRFERDEMVLLAEILYAPPSTWQYIGTRFANVATIDYQPYLLNVSDVAYDLPASSFYGSAGSVTIRIRRGAISGTGDTIDSRYLRHDMIGKKVVLRQGFITGATTLAGSVSLGMYVITGVEIADKGAIALTLTQDERVFKLLPSARLVDFSEDAGNGRLFASGVDTSELMPVMYGGIIPYTSGGVTDFLRGVDRSDRPVCAPTRLAFVYYDPVLNPTLYGKTKYMMMSNGGAQPGTPLNSLYALEYVEEWDLYALLGELDVIDGAFAYHNETGSTPPLYFRYNNPSPRGVREMYVPFGAPYTTTAGGNNNTKSNWKDVLTGSLTISSGQRLSLTINRQSTQSPANYHAASGEPITNLAVTVSAITGTCTVYEGSTTTDTRDTSISTLSVPGTFMLGGVPNTFDKTTKFYLWEPSAGGSITISKPALVFRYWAVTATSQKFRTNPHQEPLQHRGIPQRPAVMVTVWDTINVETLAPPESGTVYVPMIGPSGTIAPGSISYAYDTPIYVLYHLLNTELGITSVDFNATSFDNAYTYLITDAGTIFNDWHIGRQFQEQVSSLDLIRELCGQCGLLLHKNQVGQYTLSVVNHAGTLQATFGDTKSDFPAWGFSSGFVGSYASRFQFDYLYDHARSKFRGSIVVHKDATVPSFLTSSKTKCTNAFTAYGLDVEAEIDECFWFWTEETTQNYVKMRINWETYMRRWVRFTTKISAAHIELGDTIRTAHQAQDWASAAVNFQVRGLRINPTDASVEIYALEINEL